MSLFRIPNQAQITQANKSDLFGSIFSSRNLDLDEPGYIKLSNRSVAIASSKTEGNLGLPLSFGRKSSGDFLIATSDEPYKATISETALTLTEDTDSGNPSLDTSTLGKWWQNRWYVSFSNNLGYKSGSTWTTSLLALTSGFAHPIEVFRNRTTLVVGNGNVVKQITTAHASDTDLTLPADYEVVSMAYSNNKMGIGTMLSDTAADQNQEAYFFTWDGSSTSANSGFPVGSDMILLVIPYKSTWLVLTRSGQVLSFNGGGFDQLFTLPFFYQDVLWGDPVNRMLLGEAFVIEGDLIYVNLNTLFNLFGNKVQEYLEFCPGGIFCYSPAIGLYHRYSPSLSLASLLTVTSANVNTSTDILTKTVGTLPSTGSPVKYVSDYTGVIGGLQIGTIYYAIKHNSTQFSLAATKQDAIDGNKVNLTSTGSSNNYFLALELKDYGATRLNTPGGMAIIGSQNQVADHLVFGATIIDTASTNDYETVCFTVEGFKNIGYFTTSKVVSDGAKDTAQNISIKYRPLATGNSIVIKHKDRDILGIPTNTPQGNTHCTWTSTTTFTTTADLSEVLNYLNDTNTDEERECEVEIIDGAGAGQMSQIATISYLAGTYTIVLDDEIDGVSASDTCDVSIDNWKLFGEVTEEDTDGVKDFGIGTSSKWHKFKVILSGSGVAIEEFAGATINQIPI